MTNLFITGGLGFFGSVALAFAWEGTEYGERFLYVAPFFAALLTADMFEKPLSKWFTMGTLFSGILAMASVLVLSTELKVVGQWMVALTFALCTVSWIYQKFFYEVSDASSQ